MHTENTHVAVMAIIMIGSGQHRLRTCLYFSTSTHSRAAAVPAVAVVVDDDDSPIIDTSQATHRIVYCMCMECICTCCVRAFLAQTMATRDSTPVHRNSRCPAFHCAQVGNATSLPRVDVNDDDAHSCVALIVLSVT